MDVGVITRVVDFGGLFWDDLYPAPSWDAATTAPFARGAGSSAAGTGSSACARSPRPRADSDAARLSVESRPRRGQVHGADPDSGGRGRARPIEEKRIELASLLKPSSGSAAAQLDEIRAIGDNTGSMDLKGASPDPQRRRAPTAGALRLSWRRTRAARD